MKSAAEAKQRYHASAAGRLIIGPALARLRGEVHGQHVLSLGCGPLELAELRNAGAIERVGVDRSADALAAAAAADPQARTIVAD